MYTFPDLSGVAVDVWDWITNFVPHFTGRWLLNHARIKINVGIIGPTDVHQHWLSGAVTPLPVKHGQHIEAETKWSLFRRHLQMHFLEWKYINSIKKSLKFAP